MDWLTHKLRVVARAWRVAVAGCLLALAAEVPAAEVEIVAQGERSVRLDTVSLRAIFSVRVRSWPDGTPVKVFVLPDDHPLHQQFCREWLGTFPYVLRASWDRLVFTGTGIAPEVVGSEEEMRRKVARTRGAIGYVRRTDASEAADASRSTGGQPR